MPGAPCRGALQRYRLRRRGLCCAVAALQPAAHNTPDGTLRSVCRSSPLCLSEPANGSCQKQRFLLGAEAAFVSHRAQMASSLALHALKASRGIVLNANTDAAESSRHTLLAQLRKGASRAASSACNIIRFCAPQHGHAAQWRRQVALSRARCSRFFARTRT